jgi:DMSO/TMAO reductase YedYZ heme-binding membrane subunit
MSSITDQLLDRAGVLENEPVVSKTWLKAIKYLLPVLFLAALIIPGFTYFVTNRAGSVLFGPGIPPAIRFYTLFRLFGLYAFTFVWGQLMFGPFMTPLGKLYGRNWFYFHRMEGIFALFLATLHPIIFYTAFYLDTGSTDFVHGISHYTSSPAGYLGPVAWTLLVTTVLTALCMRKPWLQKRWRWIHLLNYAVFALAFFHSLAVGSDTRSLPLFVLYWIYGATFVAAFGYRRIYRRIKGTDNLPSLS